LIDPKTVSHRLNTVLTFVSNVATLNVGIVGSIGIIIVPWRP
jgi:hypothetical protein